MYNMLYMLCYNIYNYMSNHFRYCDSRNIEMVDSFKCLQFANAFR